MTTTQNLYKEIFDNLSQSSCSPEQLTKLKTLFDNELSRRRSECISSLYDLINILEKRGCFDEDNISGLSKIGRVVHNRNVTPLIQKLETIQQPILPDVPSNKKSKVYKLIASEIGKKWKDFARALHIPEGYIDEFEISHKPISDRVYEIMSYHEQNCDPRTAKTKLLEALGEARRHDLRNKAQNIFDTM